MRPKQSHNHKHSRLKATITAIDIQSERQTLLHGYRTIPPHRHSPINRTYAKLFRGSLVLDGMEVMIALCIRLYGRLPAPRRA